MSNNESLGLDTASRHPGRVPWSTVPSTQRLQAECDGKVVPLGIVPFDEVVLPAIGEPVSAWDSIPHAVKLAAQWMPEHVRHDGVGA